MAVSSRALGVPRLQANFGELALAVASAQHAVDLGGAIDIAAARSDLQSWRDLTASVQAQTADAAGAPGSGGGLRIEVRDEPLPV